MKFSKWTNPKNGQTRIYINGAARYGVKVYCVDGGATGNYPDNFPEIVVHTDHAIGQSEVDRIVNGIEDFVVEALSLDSAMKYSDIELLAK